MQRFKAHFLGKAMILGIVLGLCGFFSARGHQIRIVGSSSVFPFSAVVAQNLFLLHHKPVPVIEKTGSGAGIKLFCGGQSLEFPAVVNSSRPLTEKERALCADRGVTEILEIKLGYGGIILVTPPKKKKGELLVKSLTLHEIFLALSKEIFVNGQWVSNPYTRWSQIDARLPNQEICVFGPPATSGMRDALKDIIFFPECAGETRYGTEDTYFCGQFREDGVYTEMPENTKLILQKLQTNPDSMGILGFPFLEENKKTLKAIAIDGILPSLKTISSGRYPLSRPLYCYIKIPLLRDHEILRNYVETLVSEPMWQEEGFLSEKGLIVPSFAERQRYRDSVKAVLSSKEKRENPE